MSTRQPDREKVMDSYDADFDSPQKNVGSSDPDTGDYLSDDDDAYRYGPNELVNGDNDNAVYGDNEYPDHDDSYPDLDPDHDVDIPRHVGEGYSDDDMDYEGDGFGDDDDVYLDNHP